MKENNNIYTSIAVELLAAMVSGLFIGGIIGFITVLETQPSVQLPHNYQLITSKDTLVGYYNDQDKTLYINILNKKK